MMATPIMTNTAPTRTAPTSHFHMNLYQRSRGMPAKPRLAIRTGETGGIRLVMASPKLKVCTTVCWVRPSTWPTPEKMGITVLAWEEEEQRTMLMSRLLAYMPRAATKVELLAKRLARAWTMVWMMLPEERMC